MNIFEKASREKVRYHFHGVPSAEDLWDMSLQNLDAIYRNLTAEVKHKEADSLLATKTKEDDLLDLKIELVKHVFAVKSEEKEARANAAANAAYQKKIVGIIAEKQDEDLRKLPIAELERIASGGAVASA